MTLWENEVFSDVMGKQTVMKNLF